MKILVSALACNPRWGSESHLGWAAVQCLARDHELWVLTSPRNQPDLDTARAAGLVGSNVHFVYAGGFKPWHSNQLAAHLQGWREYVDFTKQILPLARELHEKVRFDLTHHLTLTSWRVPCRLWQLRVPLVFGPVGGNESLPFRFFPVLSPVADAFELARKFSNLKSSLSPEVRACIRNAAHVFAANAETEPLMVQLRGTRAGVSRLLSYSHSDTTVMSARQVPEKSFDGPLRLFAGGSLDGRKGVALALQALARAKREGVRFHYRYGGKGPEFNRIQQLAARLGLQEDVLVTDSLRGEDYARELKAAHIYLLPSLRDSAGVTLAEAMLAGCVPIVADCGGPGQLVSEECGYKVPVSSPGALIEEISKILVHVDRNREVLREKGPKAAKRIVNHFSEENYRRVVNLVYKAVAK
ncbi:MAG TPA: glycosyltransferase [Verrucomicrobiae bacterium]|jgi:hypothetical protein|nr:glycosyltransferase [Verrucomicrobiae bacterium]